jgi:hypothetical protein
MAAVFLLVTLFGTATMVAAEAPSAPAPLTPIQFTPIEPVDLVASTVGQPSAAPVSPSAPAITDFSGVVLRPEDAVARFSQPDSAARTAQPRTQVKRPRITHRVGGIATWYCKAGVSSCHYAHSGGLYAAAGAEIRKGDWRGRQVRVCSGGACIWVTLIDWCACAGNRIIDLYSDAYRRLDSLSSGTMKVTVGW